MITITDKAKEQLLQLMADQKVEPGSYVRVGVNSGGCSGLSYELDFDKNITDQDKVIEDKGLKIAVDRKSVLYLAGTELDFSDGLNGKGFNFINPNASRTCGCGESFSI